MSAAAAGMRRPILIGAATAALAVLHDVPPLHGAARKLLYVAFGAMAVVSAVRMLRARPPAAARPPGAAPPARAWRGALPLAVPAAAVAVFAAVAIWGGFGLNNDLALRSDSVYVHPGGAWLSMQSERATALWKLFHPRTYYTMETPAGFEMGHFRPLKFLFLWLVSGSIVTASVYALLVHALNAVGLALLARRWGADPWIAAGAGALFAVHPLPWQSVGITDELKFAQGMALVVAALMLYDRYARTGRSWTLAAAVGLFAMSCLFVESFIGVAVFVVLLTLVFVRTGRLTRSRAVWGLAASGFVAVLIVGALLFIELTYAPSNRLSMLQVASKRLALTAFFEPQFAFLHPLEPGHLTLATQWFAVPLAVLAGLVFSSMWGPYSGAAWLASGFMLGPALAFFEMTSGAWSGGRLAYGPAFLLCLALAMVTPPTPRALTLTRWALFGCAVAACLVTFGRVAGG